MHVPVPWVLVVRYLLGAALESRRTGTIRPEAALASTVAESLLFAMGAVIAGWSLVIFRKARRAFPICRLARTLVELIVVLFSRSGKVRQDGSLSC
jgi:hypothetical protein